MKLGQAFKMAFKSISTNKGRAFLTMLGIIIGVASVMAIVSVLMGQNKMTMQLYEAQGTNKVYVYAYLNNGTSVFDDLYDYCLYLNSMGLADGVTPNGYLWDVTVTYGTKSSANMDQTPQINLGSDQYSVVNNFQIDHGRDISKIDVDKYSNVCVMGVRRPGTSSTSRTLWDNRSGSTASPSPSSAPMRKRCPTPITAALTM